MDNVTLYMGPLCGSIVDGEDWLEDEEKEFRIAWEDFRYDEGIELVKTNIVGQPLMTVRGTARYRREGKLGHWVMEK